MKLNARTWTIGVTFVATVTTLCYWNLSQGTRSQAAASENDVSSVAEEWSRDSGPSQADSGSKADGQPRMRIVSAAMAERRDSSNPSSYLSRSRKVTKASMTRSGQNRDIVLQLAAAVREGNSPALVRLLNQPYGDDGELDGLLIEAARKLGSANQPENRALAQAKLAEFREIEGWRYQSGKPAIGALVHIAEAFGDIPGEVSASESLVILGDASLPRVVRSAAAVTLAKLNPPQALAFLASYRNDLKAALKQGGQGGDEERAFIADSIREVEELMAAL